MNDDIREQQFVQQTKSVLDESTRHFNAATLTRLQDARRRAVKAASSKHLPDLSPVIALPGRLPLTLSLTVLAIILAAAYWASMSIKPAPPVNNGDNPEDIEILTVSDNLEFYDDLGFYHWLEHGNDETDNSVDGT